MRGDDQDGMFSYISFHKRVLPDHPLRRIRTIVDRVLEQLSPRFNKLYARAGSTVGPEKLLRTLLLQLLVRGAKRAASDGAVELRPVVPLVRGVSLG
jgi:hypothetical protein